jgi:hypothetical protein
MRCRPSFFQGIVPPKNEGAGRIEPCTTASASSVMGSVPTAATFSYS